LQQEKEGKWVPVAFYSLMLAGIQTIGQRLRKKLTRLWLPFESLLASSGFNRWS
jgi:hypothetical protein